MTAATAIQTFRRRSMRVSLHDQVWAYVSGFRDEGAPLSAIMSRFAIVPLCVLEAELQLLVDEGVVEQRASGANPRYVAVVQLAVYAWIKVAA